jgi:hypothetical protein
VFTAHQFHAFNWRLEDKDLGRAAPDELFLGRENYVVAPPKCLCVSNYSSEDMKKEASMTLSKV